MARQVQDGEGRNRLYFHLSNWGYNWNFGGWQPRELPGWHLKLAPFPGGQGRTAEGGRPLQKGRQWFDKQGILGGSSWAASGWDLRTALQNLNISQSLNGFGHILESSGGSQHHLTLSRQRPPKWLWPGNGGQSVPSRTGQGVGDSHFPGPALRSTRGHILSMTSSKSIGLLNCPQLLCEQKNNNNHLVVTAMRPGVSVGVA